MIDQCDARFVDETMLGSYQYITIEFMVSKITNKDTKEGSVPHAVFLDGNYVQSSSQSIIFKNGLKQGDYLITYKA